MIFKTTWKNIRRSPYQAFAAILIMTLTFLVVSFFTFVLIGSSKVINYFESKPTLTAFFRNEVKQEDINSLENNIKKTGKVATVKFVSKQEALKIYRQQNKNDPLLLDLVTEDILPASLEISAIKIEDLSTIHAALKSSPIVSEIIYQKDVVSALTSWTNALRKIGIGLIIVLALVSIFIMVTIIGIKISQKKEDIEIMRLIGASGWYIRWPFVWEGIFYGIAGAVLGFGIATSSIWYATPFLSSFLKGIPIFPISLIFLLQLLAVELAIAIILGAFSSFLSVLRYLK
jgi:cell division transport system permease protein